MAIHAGERASTALSGHDQANLEIRHLSNAVIRARTRSPWKLRSAARLRPNDPGGFSSKEMTMSRLISRTRFGVATLALVAGLTWADAALAQQAPADSPPPALEKDVVVTGRLIASGSESATKQNVSTLDTPFSVSAYTGDFMKTIHTTQVADLYRYMTGLQKAGNTGYDLTLRGFSTTDSDRNTILVDGLPGLAVRFGSPPTVGTDHIEIVKGAASLLYGAVQPGGFVNMITKKPSATPSTELSLRGTFPGGARASRVLGGDISIDSTGPIGGSDKLLYRFVAQGSSDNTFRNYSFERGFYIAPSLTWRPDDATSITGQVEYRQIASNYASLFLLAPRLPQGANISYLADIRTNYMAPTDYLHERGLIESVFVEHRFSEGVKWNLSFRNVNHHDEAGAWDVTRYDNKDPTFNTLDLRARGQRNQRTYVFGDTYFTFHFQALGDHRMIVGASLGREVDDFNRTQFCAINSPQSPNADATCNPTTAQYTVTVNNPNFAALPPLSSFGPGAINPASRSRNHVTGVGSGVYVSDLIGFGDHIKLSLGLRYAHEHQVNFADLNEPLPVVGDATLDSSAVLPQVGFIYEPNHHLSFYASYSTSFSPVPPGTQHADVTSGGVTTPGNFIFSPTRGKGYEVGVKTQLPGNVATLTVAVFRIDQSNVIVASAGNCSSGSCSDQIGAARSEGVEVEGTAHPTPGWSLIAGYAHTNARVTQNPSATSAAPTGPLPGGQLPNSPKDAIHAFTRYDVQSGGLAGFGVGLGVSHVSSRIAYTPTPQLPVSFVLPSYTVADLGFYYSIHAFDLSVKVNNLFNTIYYASGTVTQSKVNVQPGLPRTILASISHKF